MALTWKPDRPKKPQRVITCCRVCGHEFTVDLTCRACLERAAEQQDKQMREKHYKDQLFAAGKKHAKELKVLELIEQEKRRRERDG